MKNNDELFDDLKSLAYDTISLIEGSSETDNIYKICKKYNFVDEDGFWLYED